jgi:RHS repeat-associated protein
LAKIEGTNVYFYHNDALGTPQRMTDSTGAVVWAADYKPFGEAAITISTITNNLRFPGQYFDAETGLNYNYMRDYDPATGRYIQSDPVGILMQYFSLGNRANLSREAANSTLEEINHLYIYAKANALKFVDPTGLKYYGPRSCPAKQHMVIAIEVWAYSKLKTGVTTILSLLTGQKVFNLTPDWDLYTYDAFGMCIPDCYIKIGEEWSADRYQSPFGIYDYKYSQHNIFYAPKPGDPCCK